MTDKNEEKKELTLAELRESSSALRGTIDAMDADIKQLQTNRAKAMKEFKAIIGKIETRVASGEK